MAGVGAGAVPLVHVPTGVMDTCLCGVFSGICAEGTMVTLGGNALAPSEKVWDNLVGKRLQVRVAVP